MKTGYLMAWVLCLGLLSACKPTEKNYREAYDAAKAKREASVAADTEAMVPSAEFISNDGPRLRMVGNDSVYISRDRIKRIPGGVEGLDKFNVAVGVYRMPTNAKAQASNLAEEGYEAQAVEATGNRWYAVAASFPTIEECAAFIRTFLAKHPGYSYIGLPDAPVVIEL